MLKAELIKNKTSMKIQIKTKNLELTEPMRAFIIQKVSTLEKFLGGFEKDQDVLVEVEIARPSQHHNKGNVYYAEINMALPSKKLLRAEETDFNIRVAVNKVKDKLRREIRKYKTALDKK